MFKWWRKRKEIKRLETEFSDRYPFQTKNPYSAIIFKASQKLGAHLRRYRFFPLPANTTRQYHQKAARMKGMDVKALFDNLYILEEALYSHHDINEEHKNMCIGSLRGVERSLDIVVFPKKGEGPILCDPPSVNNAPIVSLLPPGDDMLTKERFPENENIRSTRPADLRRLLSRFDASGSDSFLPLDPDVISSISDLISAKRWKDLKEIVMENTASYMPSVHLSERTGLYILELHYRIREVLSLDEPEMDGLLGLVVPGAKVLAASEGRDYLIPDDIKAGLLMFLPGYKMRTLEDSLNIIDSVQVPKPFYCLPDMDIYIEQEIRLGN